MATFEQEREARLQQARAERALVMKVVGGAILMVVGLAVLGLWGCPTYNVYSREMSGKAQLAEAEANRRISVLEANAKRDAAKALAEADVERARGVAQANQIIGESLRKNEDYLTWLWIEGLKENQHNQVIYVPTEANLPILEATRRLNTPAPAQEPK